MTAYAGPVCMGTLIVCLLALVFDLDARRGVGFVLLLVVTFVFVGALAACTFDKANAIDALQSWSAGCKPDTLQWETTRDPTDFNNKAFIVACRAKDAP